MKNNQIVYHGIKHCSALTGIPIDLLKRARQHPDCPRSKDGGFSDSGRVYMTEAFIKWLEAHKEELDHVIPGTLEYWQLMRLKSQTLTLEKRLEEKRSKVLNKQDVINTFERIQKNFGELMRVKLRQPLIERLNLNQEQIAEIDAFIACLDDVFTKGAAHWKE